LTTVSAKRQAVRWERKMVAILDSEWGIIIAVIAVLVLFGSSKLPKFARSLGSAQSEFKKGLSEGHKDSDSTASETEDNSSSTEKVTPSSIEQTSHTSSLEQKIASLEQKISSMEHNPSKAESTETTKD
jgi:sec-independent protein translocase protein TatA